MYHRLSVGRGTTPNFLDCCTQSPGSHWSVDTNPNILSVDAVCSVVFLRIGGLGLEELPSAGKDASTLHR